MTERMTMKKFVERFSNGDFESRNVKIQCEAGWYDWFCMEKGLANRLKPMGNFAKKIVNSPKFDNQKVYVFFKNNCPVAYPLYDSMSICEIEDGKVLYWIGFNQKWPDCKGTTQIVKIHGVGEVETVFDGNRTDAVKWFNEKI